jgi:lathosterol oxidase
MPNTKHRTLILPSWAPQYHTLHHTHFKCNYGQFFTFCDRFFGTIMVPDRSKFDEKAQVTKTRRTVTKAK